MPNFMALLTAEICARSPFPALHGKHIISSLCKYRNGVGLRDFDLSECSEKVAAFDCFGIEYVLVWDYLYQFLFANLLVTCLFAYIIYGARLKCVGN